MMRDTVTPSLLRQFVQGSLDGTGLAPALLGQLRALHERLVRQKLRAMKRDAKAKSYRTVALVGGGKREVSRRLRQVAS